MLPNGNPVRLTAEERAQVIWTYDQPGGFRPHALSGPLASYLILLHLAGPETFSCGPSPEWAADFFTTWSAASDDLRAVLRRKR